MGKRKGRCVRKNVVSKDASEPEHLVKAPHSFVIHRGQCSKDLMELTKDFRKVMEPFTATQLKERKNNTLKDFVSISGYLHVSHMMIFTETEHGQYMRLARLPRGPTLTFRLHSYSLSRDVVSSLKKQYVIMKAFQNAPLIVLNAFSGEGMHMKLMANMFQNIFPTINITTVKLKMIRRCVLMNYNPSTKQIDFRHYVIRATPVGLNKGTKKLVQGKVPNLSRLKDMSEFFDKAALLSESEFDDDPNAQVVLPQTLATRGAAANTKSAIRLVELGPRMSLQLMKVEDGFMDGEVLFHELVEKTEEEKETIKKKREAKKRLKEKRKTQQEENVKRKQRDREQLKQKSLEGIKKKEGTESQRLMELAAVESQNAAEDVEECDDDAEYYRQEVGEEPEKDLFTENPTPRKRKAGEDGNSSGIKKMRLDKRFKPKTKNNSDNNRGGRQDRNVQDKVFSGKRKFQKDKDRSGFKSRAGKFPSSDGKKFQNKDGNKFQNKDGNKYRKKDGNKFRNKDGNKFQNKNSQGRMSGNQRDHSKKKGTKRK